MSSDASAMQFGTVREAKEYLIRRILAQADRDGVPLSEVERNMLYFSETGWTLPNMMAISRKFDETYSQDEYEKKIGGIIRQVCDQPDIDRNDDRWKEAVQRLREEDHYLLVLIDGAARGSNKKHRGETARLIVAGAVVVAVFLPALSLIESHVSDPTIAKWIGYATFLGLVFLAWFLASRGKHPAE